MRGERRSAVLAALLVWRGIVLALLLALPGPRVWIAAADFFTAAAVLVCYCMGARRKRAAESMRANEAENPQASREQRTLQQNLLLNQMNPHFLYNTLESIRGKAILDGNVQVADMVEALSAFFRYNVSYRSAIVTLADELNNVNEYLMIQNFRFVGRFRIEQRIDETINPKTCCLPKLTLQPIVENAIVHGLESLEEGGLVTIRAMDLEGHLLISVSDNGVGMDEVALQRLCAELSDAQREEAEPPMQSEGSSGGIALMNIQKRLQLFFGTEYGLRVYSMEGVGTTVEIMIPKRDNAADSGRTELD